MRGGITCGAGFEFVMNASQGLGLLQGLFHHVVDTLLDRFLHGFLYRFLTVSFTSCGFRPAPPVSNAASLSASFTMGFSGDSS